MMGEGWVGGKCYEKGHYIFVVSFPLRYLTILLERLRIFLSSWDGSALPFV